MKQKLGFSKLEIWAKVIIILDVILVFYGWGVIGGLIIIVIVNLCGRKCQEWSYKINKNHNWAYIIGFVGSLGGLLIYYLYYNNKSFYKKVRRKNEQTKKITSSSK